MSELLKTIDLRNRTDADGTYFVVFCSRESEGSSGKPGHAYVVWGLEDNSNNRSSQKSFGFYPEPGNDLRALFSTVPGGLIDEATQMPPGAFLNARLIAKVNKQPYEESQDAIITWQTTDYNLYTKNCINFVADVARKLTLFPPDVDLFQLPSSYMKEFIENFDKQKSIEDIEYK